MEASKDMQQWIDALQDALLLSDWDIVVRKREDLGDDPNGGVTQAICYPNIRYKYAIIEFIEGTPKQMILHEFMHIALARTQQMVDRLVGFYPEHQRDNAMNLFADALEPDVELLTKIIWGMLQPQGGE